MKETFKLDFSDLPFILKACGQCFIDDIVRRIYQRKQPDGSPQKNNKLSTIMQKGHDHPLIGKGRRPVLANPDTYRMVPVSNRELCIMIDENREAIAGYVTDLGYEFFGISPEAEKEAVRLFDRYITGKIKMMYRGDGSSSSGNYGLRPAR